MRFPRLPGQRTASEGPTEWLRQGFVVVLNKGHDLLLQVGDGREVASLDDAAHEDAEPTFDLVEPRRVLGFSLEQ